MKRIYNMNETPPLPFQPPRRYVPHIAGTVFILLVLGISIAYAIFFHEETVAADQQVFSVEKQETMSDVARRLARDEIINSARLLSWYARVQGVDRSMQVGTYTLPERLTIAHLVATLAEGPEIAEKTITILPGWDLHEIGEYLEAQGIGTAKELFALVGEPARQYDPPQAAVGKDRLAPVFESGAVVLRDRPSTISYEGYLAPDTYRIFPDASLADVVRRLIDERDREFTKEMYAAIEKSGRTVHEVMTIASIVEREVRDDADRARVADLFWRRADTGWALQADSTVHFVVNKKGNVFTTAADRATDNLWNTYKYPGLPPGPIATPSLDSIMAAIYPEPNTDWFFLTTFDGEVKYAKTAEEHQRNVVKYLR